MVKTSQPIVGTFRNGAIQLDRVPSELKNDMRVRIVYLEPNYVDLAARGISEEAAAAMRSQFATIAEDWDAPEMDIYDMTDWDAIDEKG